MTDRLDVVVGLLRRAFDRLAEPLRRDSESGNFRLSSPETHTTTVDGDVGWESRPPARVRCPECGAGIDQREPLDDLDCPRCVATFSHEAFPDLELVSMRCPVCGNRMEHGQRHPNAFDIPEWATCHGCRYHWEFAHSF